MVAAPTLTAKSPGNIPAGSATAVTLTGTGLGTGLVPAVTAPAGYTVGTVTGLTGTSIAFDLTPAVGCVSQTPTLTVKTKHAISNVVLTSNVVTVTVESGHSVQVGDSIVVAAVSNTAINGTFTVTAVGAATISYALTHADILTGADTGTVTDATSVSITGPLVTPGTAGGTQDQYGYVNLLAVPASGSRAIDSASETTMGSANPLNGAPRSSATANQQSDQQWQDAGAGVSKPYPADQHNPVAALNQGIQEQDLIGEGLGDALTQHAETVLVVNKLLASNVATLTTSQAHGFIVGDSVVVAGMADANFNGTFTITVVGSTTTFSYAKTHADIGTAAVTAGTATHLVARPRRLHAPSV